MKMHIAVCTLMSAAAAQAATLYVSPAGNDGDGLSWENAKTTIQAAIDAAPAGATVLVSNGVYSTGSVVGAGNLKCRVRIDNNITVKSAEPHGAVIRGSGVQHLGDLANAVRCVEIVSGTLDGFILEEGAAGAAAFDYSSLGGGIFFHDASTGIAKNCIVRNCMAGGGGATYLGVLYDCVLTNNVATGTDGGGAMHNGKAYRCLIAHNQTLDGSGGGIYGHPNGVYEDCVIRDNSAVRSADANISFGGGGVFAGTLARCVISNNTVTGFSTGGGGGTCMSDLTDSVVANNLAESANGGGVREGTLIRCRISENTVVNGSGGGTSAALLFQCSVVSNSLTVYRSGNGGGVVEGFAYNTLIAYNRSQSVGGAFAADLYNCTVVFNTSISENAPGIHVYGARKIYNCLAFGNTGPTEAPHVAGCDIGNVSEASDIKGTLAGTSNIAVPGLTIIPDGIPIFSDAANGDFSLFADSPAINAGDMSVVRQAVDFAGNGRVAFGTVDAGAYEYCSLFVATDGDDADDGLSWATAKQTIQAALDSAEDGMEILVASGVYNTGSAPSPSGTLLNRIAITKAVKVRSVAGPDETIIQGSGTAAYNTEDAIRCVFMNNGVLDGFTIEGGATTTGSSEYQRGGGGVCIEAPAEGTCVINCIIRNNRAVTGGGITGGRSNRGRARVVDCIITNNQATYGGGGAYGAVFERCLFSHNEANDGGGCYEPHSVYNSLITANSANRYAVYSSGFLVNCTVAHNTGGGISGILSANLALTATNCIVWGNSGNEYGEHCDFGSSCSSIVGDGITVTSDPLFMDVANGDFSLQPGSPCIDGGLAEYVTGGMDLAGDERVISGVVDIGAFESPQFLQVLFDASPGVFEELGTSELTMLIPYKNQGYGSYIPDTPVIWRGFKPAGWFSLPGKEDDVMIQADTPFVSPYPHTVYQHWKHYGLTLLLL